MLAAGPDLALQIEANGVQLVLQNARSFLRRLKNLRGRFLRGSLQLLPRGSLAFELLVNGVQFLLQRLRFGAGGSRILSRGLDLALKDARFLLCRFQDLAGGLSRRRFELLALAVSAECSRSRPPPAASHDIVERLGDYCSFSWKGRRSFLSDS